MAFKALQIYSNGDVVRWIDLAAPGQPEPDHPAPVLTLTSATTSAAHSAGTAAASDEPTSSGAGSDGTTRVLAIAALVAGLLALAAAGAGLWRHRVGGG